MKGKSWLFFKITAVLLIAAAFLCAVTVAKMDNVLSWGLLFLTAVAALAFIVQLIGAQQNVFRFIAQIDSEINLTERDSLYNLPAPALIIDSDGFIIWYNSAFCEQIYTDGDAFGLPLSDVIEYDEEKLKNKNEVIAQYKDRFYKLSATVTQKDETSLMLMYMEDVTDYVILQQRFLESRPSVVLIMIDNYEDLMQNVKDTEKARVLLQVEKLFEDFMSKTSGVIRKVTTDRFFAVIEEQHLQEMMEERFKILDRARAITVSEKLSVTLSIGVGRGAVSMAESEAFAKQALDMALGRGGDQAAVKTDSGFEFFGGVSKGIEKHAKVKTRIIATALKEMIENSEKVYIMGHRFGDLDSIGSATGLAGVIHNLGKHVKVVVDPNKNLAQTLIERMNEAEDYSLYMTPEDAVNEINDETLLIVVDTHNKDFVESSELYKKAKLIVVIDHHRKVLNYIDNAVIFHHEPYASSASEMVSELVQYFGDAGNSLSAAYAEALLAGIMLDTKSFVMRTGVRTFEAAAFLRKLGADTIAVRALFANSIDAYQKKTHLVSTAEIYRRCAISASDLQSEDMRTVAPQAADELLGIAGVDASFVLYEMANGDIGFSARSMGAMNVQLIMEKLGGGGHQTMAGAQLANTTIEEAKSMLCKAIDEHIEESS